jgi:hypothetical protein
VRPLGPARRRVMIANNASLIAAPVGC